MAILLRNILCEWRTEEINNKPSRTLNCPYYARKEERGGHTAASGLRWIVRAACLSYMARQADKHYQVRYVLYAAQHLQIMDGVV